MTDNDATFENPFPSIGDEAELDVDNADDKKDDEPDTDAKIAALETSLAAQTAATEQLERIVGQIGAIQPQAAAVAPAAVEPTIDLDGLPDPTENPKDYARQLNVRVQGVARESARTAAEQVTNNIKRESEITGMWQKIYAQNPELAEFSDITELEARQEIARLQARGIDPIQYFRANSDDFLTTVSANVNSRLDKIRGKKAGDAPEANPIGRTVGLGEGDAEPRKGVKKAASKRSSMIQEIKDAQRTSGLF